jgi:uncharacterized protein (TIGR02594 family)
MTKWLEIAWQQEGAGVAEIGGPKANATIVGYFHGIGRIDVTSDEVHWCAAAYFWCLHQAGVSIAHIPNEDRLLAISGLKVGTRIDAPRVGCGCVMKRKGGHHVGFVTKWTATTVTLLGGNQSDQFCEATFKRTDDMVFMWPDTVVAKDVAEKSRIARASVRQQKDMGKAGTTQVLPSPPVPSSPPAPITDLNAPGIEGFPPFPGPQEIPGQLSAAQQSIETAISFAQFVGAKWPWVMAAIAIYYGARVAWDAWQIRQWRISDAATGKTIGAGE